MRNYLCSLHGGDNEPSKQVFDKPNGGRKRIKEVNNERFRIHDN
ncbi:unnamed protein product [Cuscuta europaea]|uniref:Uncharacterized protein n=1 Tax=Cuscuta europaea TaxID=41803 RepID=A0A9P0YID0_CUSEU|nr:unnamed protein product [Cuscuta europaea]